MGLGSSTNDEHNSARLIVAELMDSDGLDGWFDNWGYEGLATPTTSPSESRIMF